MPAALLRPIDLWAYVPNYPCRDALCRALDASQVWSWVGRRPPCVNNPSLHSLAGLVPGTPVLGLIGSACLQDTVALCRSLRRMHAGAGVVFLGDFHHPSQRISAYDAGADACANVCIDVEELMSLLVAVGRRVRQSPGLSSRAALSATRPSWSLSRDASHLLSPEGQALALTVSESYLLGRLMLTEGRPVPRDELHAGHAGAGRPPVISRPMHGDSGAQWIGDVQRASVQNANAQRVNVLVARLKRKAERHGLQLPLLAVRGCGYVFLDEDSPQPRHGISR